MTKGRRNKSLIRQRKKRKAYSKNRNGTYNPYAVLPPTEALQIIQAYEAQFGISSSSKRLKRKIWQGTILNVSKR